MNSDHHHRWKEEVEVVRERVAPSPILAGNVAGELVKFRPEKVKVRAENVDPCYSNPFREIFQFWKFPKIASLIYPNSELPLIITSSYELRFTRASRLRTRFDETYNFREGSFPKFRTYQKANF